MCPWLTVEADTIQNGEHVPLVGVPFQLIGRDRETPFKQHFWYLMVRVLMPEEWRDETGLWYFAVWENGSEDRERVFIVSEDMTVTATFYKYKQAEPTPITQPAYQRKLDPVRLLTHPTKALYRIKPTRDERAGFTQAELTLFTDKVRMVMDEQGVFTDLRHQYIAYALALDKTQREMAFMVDLTREHRILRNRFERRGLDPDVLDEIDRFVIYRGPS